MIVLLIITTRFYISLFTPEGFLKALPTLLPLWSLGIKSFLKPSQLPGEIYCLCAIYAYSAKPITRTISALTGTHFTPWVERSSYSSISVLPRDTSVTTGIRTDTLLIRSTRAWFRCSYPLGHDTPLYSLRLFPTGTDLFEQPPILAYNIVEFFNIINLWSCLLFACKVLLTLVQIVKLSVFIVSTDINIPLNLMFSLHPRVN